MARPSRNVTCGTPVDRYCSATASHAAQARGGHAKVELGRPQPQLCQVGQPDELLRVREDAGMKVLVAPDRFGVELAAAEAADAVALGWARSAPYDELDLLPLSDGGPGFLDVLHAALGGEIGVVTVRGPLGDPVPARLLRVAGTAYVEAAEAVGLHLVDPGRRDPVGASSYGVGELWSRRRPAARPGWSSGWAAPPPPTAAAG